MTDDLRDFAVSQRIPPIVAQVVPISARSEEVADEAPLSVEESARLRTELEFYRSRAVELDNQVFQMRTLLQSGKGFSELMSTESLLASFMAVCRERYDCQVSAVLLLDDLDPHSVFYRVRSYYGLPHTYSDAFGEQEETLLFRIPQDSGLLWQVIRQGEVFSVRDMTGRPRFETAFQRWSLEVLDSDVWVPLIRGGQVLGILTLGRSRRGTPIPEAEYDFLQEIAAVAATNIDSTLKYEKNARILSNLQTLYDVNQQLAEVNDFKQLTIETLATAVKALRAQKANLMLYNFETQRLEIKVVWGNIPKSTRDAINEGRIQTKTFAMGEGVSGQALKLGRPIRINDRTQIEQVGRNFVYCILAVPLMHGRDPVGVITLTNKEKEENGEWVLDTLGRFGEDDEQLLMAIADQASVNLHKARLYSLSITDRLTGLFNARHFEVSLEAALHRCGHNQRPLSLAVIDVDHFKRINDTFGHKVGDDVLAACAELLTTHVRQHGLDGCFRYGGEEFCVIMSGVSIQQAVEIAQGYRSTVERRMFSHNGHRFNVTVSVGVASYPDDGGARSLLFEAADRALYAAKAAGRNCVSFIRGDQTVLQAAPQVSGVALRSPEAAAK